MKGEFEARRSVTSLVGIAWPHGKEEFLRAEGRSSGLLCLCNDKQ